MLLVATIYIYESEIKLMDFNDLSYGTKTGPQWWPALKQKLIDLGLRA